MKKKFKRILAGLLTGAVVATTVGINEIKINAVEAEPLPTSIDAPSLVLYDYGSKNSYLETKVKTPDSVMDFYEKAVTNVYYADEYGGDTNDYYAWSDYGEWVGYTTGIQLDYKVDDGDWHYESTWDDSLYSSSAYTSFSGCHITTLSVASIGSYAYGIGAQLKELGCVTETTDGSSTYYRFNQDDHTIYVRARYYLVLSDHEYNRTTLISPWSDAAALGEGNKDTSQAVQSLGASTIANLVIKENENYYGAPEVQFDIYPHQDVINAAQWSEQYDEALEHSEMTLVVETSLDSNFAEGSVVHRYRIYEYNSLKRHQDYSGIFYDLWEELPDKDQSAFNWNGETVYLRVKYINDRIVDDNESSIESPYSNVLSVQGSVIKKYDINIKHNEYGFDSVYGYYSESYSETEGLRLGSVYCAPLEGCYVDTVEVNGTIMYDKDDESTYELLDWYYDYECFDFLEGEDRATKDLDIEITYAGTPTATYGITTESGNGGYLSTNDSYVSWDDNSLVVYHSSTPTINIYPNRGFEIDKVKIDGVENEQAKADGSYTFPAISDNSHSIEVTFKRVAYRVYSYVYHGTITTDYEGYDELDYVKIGDDITFTFAPLQDQSGNYYEIENVYIDNVLNEEAKNAGTYTFENVQAEHNIYVEYSEDPVITHDITASSGEHGSISPEGVIHAREGSTKRFDFIPDDGYEVDKVFVDDVEITNLATKEYYNISNITGEHSIHVTFKKLPVQYDITVLVSGNNPSVQTVNPAGVTPVWEGESFTVTYSPFAGYEVQKVLVNNQEVDKNGTYSIASVNADYTIEIFFKIKSYKVTFTDYDGTVLKTENVEHGSLATPPADPVREHYVFNGWDTDYSDVTTNVTVMATYKPAEYTVKFLGWDGTVLKTDTVKYSEDATAPTAPEREGYDFSHWSVGYTEVNSDVETVAVYTKKEYTVKFVDSDDTVISTQTVKHGEAAVVPADPVKEGYTFIGWDSLTYGCITNNMTFKAEYVEGTKTIYTVTATAHGNNGTVSPLGITKVVEDGSLTVYFYPDEYSKIVKVVVDGVEVELCESYSFENISANHTVDVYYAPTATINVKKEEIQNGTVTGHYELIDDEMVYVLDITADEGYVFDGIYINGTKADAELVDGKYIIRDLTGDMDITVQFKSDVPPLGDNVIPVVCSVVVILIAIASFVFAAVRRKKQYN